jgi:hypothetical protein
VKVNDSDKDSSLLRCKINYCCKKLIVQALDLTFTILASGGSLVIGLFTHDPKIGGSNPTAGAGRKKMARKSIIYGRATFM